LLAAEDGLQGAEDGERPAAQRLTFVLRNAEHVADQLDRDGGGKVRDQVDLAARGGLVEQALDQLLDARLQRAQGPRREGGRQQLPDPRVVRRIVEHQARGVMLVEQAVGEVRPEVERLVGAPGLNLAIHREAIVIAREKIGAVRHPMNRVEPAQRLIGRIGVFEEFRIEPAHIEIDHGAARNSSSGVLGNHRDTTRCRGHCCTSGHAGLGGPNA
jgi:hypothetical protein